jgi:hypothetical protein
MTYKFDNYETPAGVLNGEFTNPQIEVDRTSIVTNDINKTISCALKLVGDGYSIGTYFSDMPRNGQGWDDSDLEQMIGIKLQEFTI